MVAWGVVGKQVGGARGPCLGQVTAWWRVGTRIAGDVVHAQCPRLSVKRRVEMSSFNAEPLWHGVLEKFLIPVNLASFFSLLQGLRCCWWPFPSLPAPQCPVWSVPLIVCPETKP